MATKPFEQDLEPGTVAHHDQAEWDRLVTHVGAQPFQAWAWGELKARFGWQPYRLSSADGSSIAQVLIRPYRGLSVAYVPRGPVTIDGGPPDPSLVRSIIRLVRSRRGAFVRFEPDLVEGDPGTAELDQALRSAGFRMAERTLQPRSSIRLDIRPAEADLMAAFSKGHRADIRRAERDGVTIRVGTTEAEVDLLHGMLLATQQRKTFTIHSAAYYRVLWRVFGDDARLFIAEHGGEVVGSSLDLIGRPARHLPRCRLDRRRARAPCRAPPAVARHSLGQGARRRDLGHVGPRRRARPLRAGAHQRSRRRVARDDAARG